MQPTTSSPEKLGKRIARAAQAAKCLSWRVSEARHAAGSYWAYRSNRKENDGGI